MAKKAATLGHRKRGPRRAIPAAAAAALVLAILTAGPGQAADDWNIRCFAETGETMPVKALNADYETFELKAILGDDPLRMDVMAVHHATAEKLPVKVLASRDQHAAYSDVKAIDQSGAPVAVKAITAAGRILDVKAFADEERGRFDIKCLGRNGERLGVKAVSPEGRVFDVKGLLDLEGEELPIEVEGHVTAVPQA